MLEDSRDSERMNESSNAGVGWRDVSEADVDVALCYQGEAVAELELPG